MAALLVRPLQMIACPACTRGPAAARCSPNGGKGDERRRARGRPAEEVAGDGPSAPVAGPSVAAGALGPGRLRGVDGPGALRRPVGGVALPRSVGGDAAA